MIDSTSITEKIEAHKSTIISELSQSESQIKRELKQYEESLIKLMKNDLTRLQTSLNQQEQEQKENIAKLLKLVGWKVLTVVSITSIVISVLSTILILNKTEEKQLGATIKQKKIISTDNQNYLKFQANELIYDQQKKVYYYKID